MPVEVETTLLRATSRVFPRLTGRGFITVVQRLHTTGARSVMCSDAATEVVDAAPATVMAAAEATNASTTGAATAGPAAPPVQPPLRADEVGEVNPPLRRRGKHLQLQAQASILGVQNRELAEVAGNRHRCACLRQAQLRTMTATETH